MKPAPTHRSMIAVESLTMLIIVMYVILNHINVGIDSEHETLRVLSVCLHCELGHVLFRHVRS